LIDVLPDESRLATVIAHELGHVVLGHRMTRLMRSLTNCS